MKKQLSSAALVTLLATAALAAPSDPKTSAAAEPKPAAAPKSAVVAAGPVATPGKAIVQAVVSRYEKEIAAFEAADRKSPPQPGGVLFYGSSSVRLWKTLAEDYAGVPVLNRGFGGSTAADALQYAERVVFPCKPGTIVFYEGDNDLQKGRTPEEVFADYQAFAKLVHAKLPATRILFLAVKPSPKRLSLMETQRRLNSMVSEWVNGSKDPRLAFVDVFTPMLDKAGKPRTELFGPDRLHMNRDGYRLWTTLIGLKPAAQAIGVTITEGAATVVPPAPKSEQSRGAM